MRLRQPNWFILQAMVLIVAACGESKPSSDASSTNFDSGGMEVSFPYEMVRVGSGKLAVGSEPQTRLVTLYDSTGVHLADVGRLGSGPGEYQVAQKLLRKADSLVVVEPSGRYIIFDRDGKFARQFTSEVRAWSRAAFARGDSILVATYVRDRTRFGYPLHVLTPDGAIIRSFGSDDRSINQFDEPVVLTPSSDSTFWIARPNKYQLEHWHISGRLLLRIDVPREFFPPAKASRAEPMDQVRPQPRVQSIYHAPDKRLYVLLRRARGDWRPAPATNSPFKESSAHFSVATRLQWTEQIVEVLDSADGRLIEEYPLAGAYFLEFLDDGSIFGVREDSEGREIAVVHTLSRTVTSSSGR